MDRPTLKRNKRRPTAKKTDFGDAAEPEAETTPAPAVSAKTESAPVAAVQKPASSSASSSLFADVVVRPAFAPCNA